MWWVVLYQLESTSHFVILTMCLLHSNLHTCHAAHVIVQKRTQTQLAVWHQLVQTIACEDGEALQQVFIGYNGNVWECFSLSHCLSLSDTDDQQNCALRNLERSLSFMERNKIGPKTEAWENNLQRNIFIIFRDCEALLVLPQVVCVNCRRVFVLTDRLKVLLKLHA